MSRLLEPLWSSPIAILAGIVVFTGVALWELVDFRTRSVRLSLDPSVNRLIAEGDDERLFYERVRHVFGSDETVLVVLPSDDVLDSETMDRVIRLTERLEGLLGVHHVRSLATATNWRADEDGLQVESIAAAAKDSHQRARLRQELLANPLFRGNLVSEDGRATALLVVLQDFSDRPAGQRQLAAQILEIISQERGDREIWVTGSPIIKAATSEALLRGLRFTLPAIGIVAVGVLALAFRTLHGIVLPILTIVLALIWTLGAASGLSRSLNLLTSIVPPLIVTVGIAYAIHVVSEFRHTVRHRPVRNRAEHQLRVRETMRAVTLPVSITALTTAAGFLALTLSPVPAIQEFGWLCVLGVVCTLVLCVTFIPASLSLFCWTPRGGPPPVPDGFTKVARALAGFDLRYRRQTVGVGIALLAVALYGASTLRVGTRYVGGFRPDAPVRVQYDAINRTLGGVNTFYIVVDGQVNGAFADPAVLREIESLQTWLEQQPEIDGTTSIVDHLKLIHRSFNAGRPEYWAIPNSKAATKQLLVFGGGEEIESYVDSAFHTAKLTVRANVEDTAAISALMDRIEARLGNLPAPLHGRVTGNVLLLTRTVDQIARGQLESIGAALVVIYLVLSVLFMSFRTGAVALLPNLLPIAVYFGTLGFSGVTLNPSTSLIACLALGIAVDDTIHYLVRFSSDARKSASEEQATFSALGTVIRPVTFTSLALVLGFLVLTGSELRNQVQFGVLAAFTIAVAWLADLTLTPALGAGVRFVTLWDVLRLDLGHNPQDSIALFEGLTTRQARIFALMSDIRELEVGERLMTRGESGKEIYVVIDGELVAWIERDGSRIELSRMGRGAVVGEVGYFAQRRTANVDVVRRARLIRFEPEDLERLRRHYPRVASGVYANLNRIQAERLARTTSRVQ